MSAAQLERLPGSLPAVPCCFDRQRPLPSIPPELLSRTHASAARTPPSPLPADPLLPARPPPAGLGAVCRLLHHRRLLPLPGLHHGAGLHEPGVAAAAVGGRVHTLTHGEQAGGWGDGCWSRCTVMHAWAGMAGAEVQGWRGWCRCMGRVRLGRAAQGQPDAAPPTDDRVLVCTPRHGMG